MKHFEEKKGSAREEREREGAECGQMRREQRDRAQL
jgi:hypothetical protein